MQLSGIPAALLCACPPDPPGPWYGGAIANWLASAGSCAYSLVASTLFADTGSARRACRLGRSAVSHWAVDITTRTLEDGRCQLVDLYPVSGLWLRHPTT